MEFAQHGGIIPRDFFDLGYVDSAVFHKRTSGINAVRVRFLIEERTEKEGQLCLPNGSGRRAGLVDVL